MNEAIGKLTPRQMQLMRPVAKGYENKEIAYQLGMRSGTVNELLRQAKERMSVRTRVAAVLAWYGLPHV